jgi:hypothetical protein
LQNRNISEDCNPRAEDIERKYTSIVNEVEYTGVDGSKTGKTCITMPS